MNGEPRRNMRVGVIGTGVMGGHHVRLLDSMPEAELAARVSADYTLHGHTALAMRALCRRVTVHLVSELEPALVEKLGMRPAASVAEAVAIAAETLPPASRAVALERAGALLPPAAGPPTDTL